jgi:CBS domain-containing protein
MREQKISQEKIKHLKLDTPICIESGTKLEDVVSRMRNEKWNCVLICEKDRCIGIFTERDYLNKILGKQISSSVPINEFMSTNPRTLTADDTVEQAIRIMKEYGYRNVPLVDRENRCTGLVRIRDIIRYLAELYPEEVLNVSPNQDQKFVEPDGA